MSYDRKKPSGTFNCSTVAPSRRIGPGKMTLSAQPFQYEHSTREAVLLLHGLGGGPYEVQRLGEHLAEVHGLSVQALRLPGHGEARRTMPASSWPEWYGAAEQAWKTLSARFETVHLVGFSTGAVVALKLALEHPSSGKLVLLAPFMRVFRPRGLPMRPEQLVRAFTFLQQVPRRAPPLADRTLRAEVDRCAGYRTFNLQATRSALDLIALVTPRLGELRRPTLIVQGDRDTVVDPSGAPWLAERLGPTAELVRLPRSNHLVTLDADAAEVLERAGLFLTRR